MNKEEIEEAKKHYIFTTEHELDDSNKILKEYIQYLKQKETILDKVTDKLKDLKEIALEDKEKKKIIELPNGIRYEDKVISLDTFIFIIENLLEIIEGEKE